MSDEEFWETFFIAKEQLEAEEAALSERARRHAEFWGPAWEEVFRKVRELEEEA